jgi:hypothetical protein
MNLEWQLWEPLSIAAPNRQSAARVLPRPNISSRFARGSLEQDAALGVRITATS